MARARARSGAPGLSGFTRGLGWSSLGQGSAFFSGYRTYPLSRAESAGSTSQYLLKTTTIRGSDISIVVGTDAEDRSAGCLHLIYGFSFFTTSVMSCVASALSMTAHPCGRIR